MHTERYPEVVRQRFWAKVDKSGECWLWTAAKGHGGYGKFRDSVAEKAVDTHRFVYEMEVGPIPAGMVIDHLCRTPACVNPAHLEVVTQGENVRRSISATKPGCANGHPLSGPNLYLDSRGNRQCRTCRRAAQSRYMKRKRAA